MSLPEHKPEENLGEAADRVAKKMEDIKWSPALEAGEEEKVALVAGILVEGKVWVQVNGYPPGVRHILRELNKLTEFHIL